jgi:hypothetical protein
VKTLIISLVLWTFIIPCVIAIYLILRFADAFMPNFYIAIIGLVVALGTLAIGNQDASWRSTANGQARGRLRADGGDPASEHHAQGLGLQRP